MKTMVLMIDKYGTPRAWGSASNELAAREEARRQLEVYCAKKREVGDLDLADPATFETQVELVRELEPGALVAFTTGRASFRFGVLVARSSGDGWLVCKWMDNSRRWTLPQRTLEGNLEPVVPERLRGHQAAAVKRAKATIADGRVAHPNGHCSIPVLP